VWYLALLSLHGLLSLVAFGVVTSLLTFHLMICYRKQTTLEWILEDMKKKQRTQAKRYRRSCGETARDATDGLGKACKAPRTTGAVSSTRGAAAEAGPKANAPVAPRAPASNGTELHTVKVDVPTPPGGRV